MSDDQEVMRRRRFVERVNANRENRLEHRFADRTRGYIMAGGMRFNTSRRGRIVPAMTLGRL